MTDRSYNRSESIVICDKDFNFTPDRKEFLGSLVSAFPNQTVFSKEDFDAIGGMPYWCKSSRYDFKTGANTLNLEAVISGYKSILMMNLLSRLRFKGFARVRFLSYRKSNRKIM